MTSLDMQHLRRGVAAGLTGTLVVSALEPLERAWLGRAPTFQVGRMAGRLADRHTRLRLSRARGQQAGRVARRLYGGLWGAALALARSPRKRPGAGAGLALGAAVLAFELWALPRSGATPPVRAWRSGERGLLALQALAFGLTAALTLRRAEGGASVEV